MKVIKRDERETDYEETKIFNAIYKAMHEVYEDMSSKMELIESITHDITEYYKESKDYIYIEDIQNLIINKLKEYKEDKVAKRYSDYREEHEKRRKEGWLMTDLQKDIWDKKYKYNGESTEEWLDRISNGNAELKRLIEKNRFMFGGRILANRKLQEHGKKVTYSNCYALAQPEDDLEGIFKTAFELAKTFSYSGGVGIDISKLRPRGAKVSNAAKTTTGAVSFMDLYSLITQIIGQNGRRGALMISLQSNHPDIMEFIGIKKDLDKVTHANISIKASDYFMTAAHNKEPYKLLYANEEHSENIEETIQADDLFTEIAKANWEMAEPGMLFWNRIQDWHMMSEYDNFEFAGVNPCAEEPLPAYGSCLLGSINLAEFVINPFTNKASIDIPKLVEAVHIAVKGLNEVLDEGLELHPLKEQTDCVRDWRQIGLGIMGLADMLIKMKMAYGSTKSLALCDVVSHIILTESIKASSNIAKEKGSFAKFDFEKWMNSEFVRINISPDIIDLVEEQGLRNSQLLTIAPTGSISTMLGISGGMEPMFAKSYTRTTQSLHGKDTEYKVYTPIVEEYMKKFDIKDESDLPEYFVSSHEIPWKNRIEMQAVWQKHIDASISSTVNLPEEATIDDVKELYHYAWKMGLKGITVYRDNCKRSAILSTDKGKEIIEESVECDT